MSVRGASEKVEWPEHRRPVEEKGEGARIRETIAKRRTLDDERGGNSLLEKLVREIIRERRTGAASSSLEGRGTKVTEGMRKKVSMSCTSGSAREE